MIVVGGENLIDFIQSEQSIEPQYIAKPGGSPYNCALAIGRQGTQVGYLTPISSDNLGQLLADTLIESNVRLLTPRRKEPTSLAVVSISGGIPSYQFYREKTAERMVSKKQLTLAFPKMAKAFYLGSLALTDGSDAKVWADYYCEMHDNGIFTALDPNIRPAFIHDRSSYLDRLNAVMERTDLLKLSDEDLAWLCPNMSTTDAADELFKKTSAKLIVVTLGEKGAFAISGEGKVSVESVSVSNMCDTVGAGDTFMATLLAHLSRNQLLFRGALSAMSLSSIEELLVWSARAAALNCEKHGCNPPTLEQLMK